jgi:hypothetical protein
MTATSKPAVIERTSAPEYTQNNRRSMQSSVGLSSRKIVTVSTKIPLAQPNNEIGCGAKLLNRSILPSLK